MSIPGSLIPVMCFINDENVLRLDHEPSAPTMYMNRLDVWCKKHACLLMYLLTNQETRHTNNTVMVSFPHTSTCVATRDIPYQ